MQDSFPELELVIVGDGPYRSKVECSGRGLRTFTGFIPKRDKIVVSAGGGACRQFEGGLGAKCDRANACGCPVVENDTTGL